MVGFVPVGIERHVSPTVGVVVATACRAALVNNNAVEIVNLTLCLIDFPIDSPIHVSSDIERHWIAHFALDFTTEHIEPLYRENQNPRGLVD